MSDTPTYDQLSALCAQMVAALETVKPSVMRYAPEASCREFESALTAYCTLSSDPVWQRVPDMVRELTALKEAVTPSAGTKAAYMGEFSFNHVVRDGNGDEDYEPITVPWTTIKEIMAAIANRARGEG